MNHIVNPRTVIEADVNWDEKGYGFATPHNGGDKAFVHLKNGVEFRFDEASKSLQTRRTRYPPGIQATIVLEKASRNPDQPEGRETPALWWAPIGVYAKALLLLKTYRFVRSETYRDGRLDRTARPEILFEKTLGEIKAEFPKKVSITNDPLRSKLVRCDGETTFIYCRHWEMKTTNEGWTACTDPRPLLIDVLAKNSLHPPWKGDV